MSLQYLKKDVRDEVDFFAWRSIQKFPTSWFQHFKHQSFLQGDTIILLGMIKHSQSTQGNKFAISLQYLKKKSGIKFVIKVFQRYVKCRPDMSKVPK